MVKDEEEALAERLCRRSIRSESKSNNLIQYLQLFSYIQESCKKRIYNEKCDMQKMWKDIQNKQK